MTSSKINPAIAAAGAEYIAAVQDAITQYLVDINAALRKKKMVMQEAIANYRDDCAAALRARKLAIDKADSIQVEAIRKAQAEGESK